MKTIAKLSLYLAALAASLSAAARDNACLIQGTVAEDGIRQVLNYCAANKGMSEQDFRKYCQELLQAQREGLSPAAASKISIKFENSCPRNHKGTCEGAFGQKWSLLYMSDDYSFQQGSYKLFCDAADGKWKQ